MGAAVGTGVAVEAGADLAATAAAAEIDAIPLEAAATTAGTAGADAALTGAAFNAATDIAPGVAAGAESASAIAPLTAEQITALAANGAAPSAGSTATAALAAPGAAAPAAAPGAAAAGVGGPAGGAVGAAGPASLPAAAPDLMSIDPALSQSISVPAGGGSGAVTPAGATGPDAAMTGQAFNNATAISPTAATTSSSAPTSIDKFLDDPSLRTGFGVLKANPGTLLSAAGLGFEALKGTQAPKGLNQLTQEAQGLQTQGAALQQYLATGTLPAGVQSALDVASESARTAIRGQYASRGMAGSSAEAADLARVDQTSASQGSQIALQLLQTGVNETQLSSQLFQQIMANSVQNDQGLMQSVGNLAAAAGGGGTPINLTVSKS